jgi:hypothetical protein
LKIIEFVIEINCKILNSHLKFLKFYFKNSFNCFIFLLKYVYIMITKPNYNIDIILLIINSYLTCEIIENIFKYSILLLMFMFHLHIQFHEIILIL